MQSPQKPIGVAIHSTNSRLVRSPGGKPVVISTNGFTKPALQIASDLNVVLFGTHDLCRLAGKDKIQKLRTIFGNSGTEFHENSRDSIL
jgi:hypothetical protein